MPQKPQSKTNNASKGVIGSACAVGDKEAMFTRPSSIGSYVVSKSKINPRMLHQSQALKATAADKSREKHETGRGSSKGNKLANNMVEMSGAYKAPVSSALTGTKSIGRKPELRVLVLDKNKQPLMPCHQARARILVREGKAKIHRLMPYTIRLTKRIGGVTQPVAVKIDPGAKTTGLALVRLGKVPTEQHVLFAMELQPLCIAPTC